MFDIFKIKKEFKILQNNSDLVYFDNSATTLKPNCVINKILEYYELYPVSGARSEFQLALKCQNELKKARKSIQKFINASDINEIIFSFGATDSLNKIARMIEFTLEKDDEIVVGLNDHTSNLLPWINIAKKKQAKLIYVDVNDDHRVTLEMLKSKISTKTKIVSINTISNVFGKINEYEKIGNFLKDKNVFYVLDAAQSIAHIKTDVQKINCDFLAFSGHKVFGPTGIGIIFINKKHHDLIPSSDFGGGMVENMDKNTIFTYKKGHYKFEAGTPNYSGIVGLGAAIEFVNKISLENIYLYEHELAKYLYKKVNSVKNIQIYNPNPDIPILCINIKGFFCQDLAQHLDSNNICARSGDNCVKLSTKLEQHNRYVRLSLSIYNTKKEIDYLVKILNQESDYLDAFF